MLLGPLPLVARTGRQGRGFCLARRRVKVKQRTGIGMEVLGGREIGVEGGRMGRGRKLRRSD
jgi:hypothetical protein